MAANMVAPHFIATSCFYYKSTIIRNKSIGFAWLEEMQNTWIGRSMMHWRLWATTWHCYGHKWPPLPPSFLYKVQLKIQNSKHNVIKHKEHHKKYRGKKEEDTPPLPLEVTIYLGKTSPACHNVKVQTIPFESIFLVKIDCSWLVLTFSNGSRNIHIWLYIYISNSFTWRN